MPPRIHNWYHSTFGYALAGAVVLWAALPPLDLWLLGWTAPVWWVLLIRQEHLGGRRPYGALWLAGFLFWLAVLHWLRLPHPATSLGWVALSFYFAFYLPMFVGLSRVAVHRLRVPVILAAPIVWTGLELARGHLLTGMTMASLGHTQYRWITLVQLSDLAGAYGVSFVVMLVAACLARMIRCNGWPLAVWPLVPAVAVLAATLLYGHLRMSGDYTMPGARIALIQGSIDTKLKEGPGKRGFIFRHYCELSQQAVRQYAELDLVVWPETMFREPLITYQQNARKPELFKDWSQGQFQRAIGQSARRSRQAMGKLARALDVPLVLGVDHHYFGPEGMQLFNSAALVSREGKLVPPVYNKIHLVMFGEYVPFAGYFPCLQRLTPLPVSLTAGDEPVSFDVAGLRIAPNICYETVLPHVIRRQVNILRAGGAEPDVLVNLTNDGWFWGSSELDMHLICGVFRAVECRKPLLIAANTGFSAWIDGDGRILRRGRRRATDIILAEVRPDRRGSWYLRHGDWPAGICLVACVLLAVLGCWAPIPDYSRASRLST